MTNKTYEKATELRDALRLLNEAWQIMCFPYPKFNIFKPRFAFSYPSKDLEVDFVSLDKTTRDELKEAIKDVIEKRQREIAEEIKQL